jgi:hypothetical protein
MIWGICVSPVWPPDVVARTKIILKAVMFKKKDVIVLKQGIRLKLHHRERPSNERTVGAQARDITYFLRSTSTRTCWYE